MGRAHVCATYSIPDIVLTYTNNHVYTLIRPQEVVYMADIAKVSVGSTKRMQLCM